MSDVLPTDDDERKSEQMFLIDGRYDVRRMGMETARHRRLLMQAAAELDEVKRCINGDEATGYEGMQSKLDETHIMAANTHQMMCEMYERETGKEPKSDTHALERKGGKRELERYVYMGIGIIITIATMTTIFISLIPYIRGDGQ